jgi:Amt family ammonium transporter
MVWDANGLIYNMGALDFAGGTVVHINAGVAGFIGAIMVGKRIGFGKRHDGPAFDDADARRRSSMLWIGWFGFNAGSNLEASGGAACSLHVNTFVATAAAILSWCVDRSRSPAARPRC